MKIHGFGDEVLFDEFPKECGPNQKVFITNLYLITTETLPKEIPKIYTTYKLATQLVLYFRLKGMTQLSDDNFVILHPSVPVELVLNNELMSVLAVEAKEAGRNLIILIQKEGKVTHLYAGINTDIRSAVMNRTFANWISRGVERLYMELKRATEISDDREMNNVIKMIETTLKTGEMAKIYLIVPLLGYEHFIQRMFEKFRSQVALKGTLHELYSTLTNQENLERKTDNAKIIIDSECPTDDLIKIQHKLFKFTTIKITEQETPNSNWAIGYCELYWSPLPTPFHLKLLATLVHPAHLYGITDTHALSLPDYLKQLCVASKPIPQLKPSPMKSNHTKSPLKSNQTKRPLKSNQAKSPMKSNHTKSPLKSNHTKSPLKSNQTKSPLKSTETLRTVKPNQSKENTKTSLNPTGELPTKEDISPDKNTTAVFRIHRQELQYLPEFESDDSS